MIFRAWDIKSLLSSSLFKTAGIYGVLNIIRQLIPFLLLPVITHYLTPADYGVLAMFNILISLIYVFISLNLDAAIGREYFDRDLIDFPNYVMNCLGVGVLCALLIIPVIYFLGPWIHSVTGVPTDLLWVVLVIGFCRYVTQTLLIIWQSGSRAFSYSVLQILQIIADVGLSLFFIIVLGMELQGRIDGVLYSGIIFAVVALVCLLRGRWLKYGYNPQYIKMGLLLGVPMIPHVLGGIIISMADRALLMNILGATETGYYFIGMQIGSTIAMAVLAFNQAWNPWLFQKLKDNDDVAKKNIVRFTYAYCVFVLLGAGTLSLIAPFIFTYLLSDAFSPGLAVVSWIAVGSAFTGMYYMVSGYIIYARKTHILSYLTLFSGIVNVTLSYYLILQNGYVGAAQGTAIANILLFLLAWVLAMKSYPMPWFSKNIFLSNAT